MGSHEERRASRGGGIAARLEAAVARGIITAEQAAAIRALDADDGSAAAPPTFTLPHVSAATIAYALGAITVVVAMLWFLSDRWSWLGPWGVIATCGLYAAVFLGTARVLRREGFAAASGLAVLLAVAMVPPAVAASNDLTHWFEPLRGVSCRAPDFLFWPCRGQELVIELATALAALVALRTVRFSLLVVPLAGIAVRLLFHLADGWWRGGVGEATSGWTWAMGASLLAAAAYATDRRQRGDEDFARWLHLAAAFSAVVATPQLLSAYEAYRHLLVPGAFVAFAAALLLRRLPWLLLGMGWFVGYVTWLAADVFRDTPAFPIVLAALGIAVIIATVWVQRNAARLVARFGTVASDGRPRFPGGVPLLLLPAVVAALMIPAARRDDAERWRDHQWSMRRAARHAGAARAREREKEQAQASEQAGSPGRTPVPPRVPRPAPGEPRPDRARTPGVP